MILCISLVLAKKYINLILLGISNNPGLSKNLASCWTLGDTGELFVVIILIPDDKLRWGTNFGLSPLWLDLNGQLRSGSKLTCSSGAGEICLNFCKSESWKHKILKTLVKSNIHAKYSKIPLSENVCLCRLLNILANFSNLFLHTGKQCGPWSDCS